MIERAFPKSNSPKRSFSGYICLRGFSTFQNVKFLFLGVMADTTFWYSHFVSSTYHSEHHNSLPMQKLRFRHKMNESSDHVAQEYDLKSTDRGGAFFGYRDVANIPRFKFLQLRPPSGPPFTERTLCPSSSAIVCRPLSTYRATSSPLRRLPR